MGYLPDFENDIFISYAHKDNQPLSKGQEGWISQFHESLGVRVTQLLGADVSIWRDAKLQGNDYLSDTFVKQFPNIAVLVSILTPAYINSEWCLRELEEFCQAAEANRGVRIEDKARIFKVVKTPVPREQQPAQLQGMLGYNFYRIDPATERPWEFRPQFAEEIDKDYLTRLEDVAWGISQLLQMLRERRSGNGREAAAAPAIYLAETTSDLEEAHDRIKRQLIERNYTVLPNRSLPHIASGLTEQVREDLQRCVISVHLVGEKRGFVPEGSSLSVVELQNQLALERGKNEAFSQLIWMPPELQAAEETQQQFINSLRAGTSLENGAELLETSLEELEDYITTSLENRRKKETEEPAGKENLILQIYLLCDEGDLDAATPLEDYLFDQGFEVKLKAFEGDEDSIFEAHKEKLIHCDAALIFYGSGGDAWLDIQLADLVKSPGYGRKKPFIAKAVYIAGPETRHKQRFRSHDVEVIRNFGEFSPRDLAGFLSNFLGKGGSR